MGQSSTCGHNPKLIVCPCLHHWVWSQTTQHCSSFCLDWMTWGSPGHPAAQPSATRPKKPQHVLESTINWWDFYQDAFSLCLPVQAYNHNSSLPPRLLGQTPALLSLRRNTPENTPHTPYTYSSALSGIAVGDTQPGEERQATFSKCSPVFLHLYSFMPNISVHYTCSTAGGTLQLCISSLMCAGV